jgi:hypothetical protein
MKPKLIGTLALLAFASIACGQDKDTNKTVTLPKEDYQKLLDEHKKLLQEMQEMKAFKAQMQESIKKPAASQAETDQALDEMEKELKQVKQMAKDSFPGTTKMLLTGYGATTFTATSKGYGPSQPPVETVLPADRTSRSFFTATFNPILLWKMSDRLLFEGEMEMELEDNGDTSLSLEMAHMSYVLNDYITVSAGKFLNPMDYFVERQHMGWVNKMPDKPLAVYDGLIPDESLLGAQVRGAIPLGPTKFGYAFFVANAPTLNTNVFDDKGNPNIATGTLTGGNAANFGNHLAVGGRVGFYPIPEFEIGYGFEYTSVRPSGFGSSDIHALLHSVDGTYVRESERLKGIINLHAQWVWSQVDRFDFDLVDPTAGIGAFSNNRNGGYAQLAYRPTRVQNKIVSNLEPVVRYDMINQKKTPIGFDEKRWSFGLNYWLGPSAVVKAAYEFDQQNGQGRSGNAFLLQGVIGF